MMKVDLYADGSCSGNPGPGGWGTILKCGNAEKTLSGGSKDTTNNIMELTAVIEGLKALKAECVVRIITDSKYVVDAFNKGWIANWQKNGWRTSDKKPVKNQELWKELLALVKRFPSTFEWVKGHEGNPYNERANDLAQQVTATMK